MIDFSSAMNYLEYIESHNSEERRKLADKLEGTRLSTDAVKQLQGIEERINVVVFSEGYCPDCHVVIPFLLKMNEVNNNIQVKYMHRKGNEEILANLSGESRIPTVVTFDIGMKPKGIFVEMPVELKESMQGKSLEEIKSLIARYREGEYNELIEKSLLNIIK